jgi:hypothetical protein
MPLKGITFGVAKELGLELPDVKAATTSRGWSLKCGGRMMACPAIHKSAEPDSLVVRIGFDKRKTLLAEHPASYYLTDHYLKYPAILVRLPRVTRKSLRELLVESRTFIRQSR